MSDITARPAAAPTPWAPVVANLVAALIIGSAVPHLVRTLTAAGEVLSSPPGEFGLVDVAPQLVVLVGISLALIAALRPFAWLLAGVGLLGLAGLYLAGAPDTVTLTIFIVVIFVLLLTGLLLAFAHAAGPSRWAIAVGLAAGIGGGRDGVSLLVDIVQRNPRHGDDLVFGVLGVLVVAAGGLLLLTRSATLPGPTTLSWSAAHWALGAVAVVAVVGVGLTTVWERVFHGMEQDIISVTTEQDQVNLQTWDQLARLGIAVVVAAVLVVAAARWGGSGAARWVLVGLATGLVVPGGWLRPSTDPDLPFDYSYTWLTVALAVIGAAAGGVLVLRAGRRIPWEAVGLVLVAVTLFVGDSSALLIALSGFGLGLAVSAAVANLGEAAGDTSRTGGVAVALGLGAAAWVLTSQAVTPVTQYRLDKLGGVDYLPILVLVAAAVGVVFAVVSRPAPAAATVEPVAVGAAAAGNGPA